MIPREPPRRSQMGFLFLPPFRIQGLSVAGEESVVQVPELDIAFDIGLCPRPVLASPHIALSHAHMDHAAAISYYFSQRFFQGMGVGTMICHPALEEPIHTLMRAWVDLEAQRTPYNLIPLAAEEEMLIKPHVFVRAFATKHTVPSLGFVVLERRSKLKAELVGTPQEKLVALKNAGQEITQEIEVPLVCYTGDTSWGAHFERPDVLNAKILITECTFMEAGHRDRAAVGQHLHLDHVVRLLGRSHAEAVVLTHLSRRTRMREVRQTLEQVLTPEDLARVHVLMDNRTNRQRYERQLAEAGQADGRGKGSGV